MEKYRTIEEFPNYQISNLGNIKNSKNNRVLRPHINKDGYVEYMFKCVDGKRRKRRVHRLVALAFIPNPENKPEIHHKNFIKTDNVSDNLMWCTTLENNNFNKNHPKIEYNKGCNHYRFSGYYSVDGVLYTSLRDAASKLGISRQTVLNRFRASKFPGYSFIPSDTISQ